MHRVDAPGVRLSVMGRPRAGDWLEEEVLSWKRQGIDVILSLLEDDEIVELGLMDEKALVEAHGLEFWSFPIPDRGVPDLGRFRKLIERISRELRGSRSVAVHCRAGIGRTGLVAACAMKSLGFSANEAVGIVSRARGVPIPDTEVQLKLIADFR